MLAGAVGLLGLALGGPAHAAPFISEVMFDPNPGSGSESALEWLELHNPDPTPVSLEGWRLEARATSTRTYTFGAVEIPAMGMLVVGANGDLGGLTSCTVAGVTWGSSITLNNSGTPVLELFDATSTPVDAVSYLASGYPDPPGGAAIGVVDLSAGNDDPANWAAADCVYGTPAGGAAHQGTPGLPNVSCGGGMDAGSPSYACAPIPDAGPMTDASVPADAGAGVDASTGPPDAGSVPPAPFFSEIFFDAPGTSDTGFEWLEIHNPTSAPISLQGYTVRAVGSSTKEFTLGANAIVPINDVLLLSANEFLGGVTSCPVSLVHYGSALTLYNSGSVRVELVDPMGAVVDVVAYRNAGYPAPVSGRSLAVRDVNSPQLNNDPANWMVSDCGYGSYGYGNPPVDETSYGTPGLPNVECGGAMLTMLRCYELPDAGFERDASTPAGDGGLPPDLLNPRDAGAEVNDAPTVSVTEPAADVAASAGAVTVTWTASDPDGDPLRVSILRAAMGEEVSGDEVLTGLPASGTQTWDASASPPGRYRVLVRVDDGHGHVAVAAAPGTVEVAGASGTTATISIERPRGGEVVTDSINITLRTTATDGIISLFYDTDSAGADGKPIAGGIRGRAGVQDVVWKTAGVPNGDYFIYAVLEDDLGSAVGYARGAVQVRQGGSCGCEQTSADTPAAGYAMLALCAILFGMRRGTKRLVRGL